jgi:hypothetical protein
MFLLAVLELRFNLIKIQCAGYIMPARGNDAKNRKYSQNDKDSY